MLSRDLLLVIVCISRIDEAVGEVFCSPRPPEATLRRVLYV
jgi:hypothetical protein